MPTTTLNSRTSGIDVKHLPHRREFRHQGGIDIFVTDRHEDIGVLFVTARNDAHADAARGLSFLHRLGHLIKSGICRLEAADVLAGAGAVDRFDGQLQDDVRGIAARR